MLNLEKILNFTTIKKHASLPFTQKEIATMDMSNISFVSHMKSSHNLWSSRCFQLLCYCRRFDLEQGGKVTENDAFILEIEMFVL